MNYYLGGLQNPIAAYLNDLYGWVDELDTLVNIHESTLGDLSVQTAQLIYWSDFVDQDLDYLFAWITSHVQQENAALGDIWTAINTLDGDITTLFANDQTLSGRITQANTDIDRIFAWTYQVYEDIDILYNNSVALGNWVDSEFDYVWADIGSLFTYTNSINSDLNALYSWANAHVTSNNADFNSLETWTLNNLNNIWNALNPLLSRWRGGYFG
jgi:hypothetical protein